MKTHIFDNNYLQNLRILRKEKPEINSGLFNYLVFNLIEEANRAVPGCCKKQHPGVFIRLSQNTKVGGVQRDFGEKSSADE